MRFNHNSIQIKTNPDATLNYLFLRGMVFLKSAKLYNYNSDLEKIFLFIFGDGASSIDQIKCGKISERKQKIFYKALVRRAQGTLLQYILNKASFHLRDFYVNRSTIIPREGSGILINEMKKIFQNKEEKLTFADLGSGCGCIGLSILADFQNSKCFLVEKSYNATKAIHKNASKLRLSNRSTIQNKSWNEFHSKRKLDFIVSNPPYLVVNKKSSRNFGVKMMRMPKHEPITAFFSKQYGVKPYKEIMEIGKKYLKKGGFIIFEVGENFSYIKIPHCYEIVSEANVFNRKRCIVLKFIG